MTQPSTAEPKPSWLVRRSIEITAVLDMVRVTLMVGAILLASEQISSQWRIQNEQDARAAFRDYLRISMENPKYSHPDLLERDFDDVEAEEYFWYVQLMSQTFEEVFAHVPEVDAWIDLAEVQLTLHCRFFASENYVADLYSAQFQETIAKILAEQKPGYCSGP